MKRQKCHCNGSRGTDCDWCQGSGWKTGTKRISYEIPNNEADNTKIKTPIEKGDQNKKGVEQSYTNTSNRRLSIIKRFDDILAEINLIGPNESKDLINQIREKIDDLLEDLKKLGRVWPVNDKSNFNKLVDKYKSIKNCFRIKFENKKEKQKKAKAINKPTIPKKTKQKNKSKPPTLADKFNPIFENLKNKMK